MDDNIKALLIMALPVGVFLFGSIKLFIAESEFKKGIYTIIECGMVFMGWVLLINRF